MPEFTVLAALGPKAVPLVLWQLVKGQKVASAVFLCMCLPRCPVARWMSSALAPWVLISSVTADTKLEHDPSFIVHDTSLELQVATILENNFRRTRAIRNALLDWAEYFDRGLASRAEGPTDCEGFEELVRLGPPVIPQMMLMYKPRDGPIFGYELLHAIMWGYTTQQQTVSLSQQYQMWDEWFQGKAYDEAPHYARPEERQAAGLDY